VKISPFFVINIYSFSNKHSYTLKKIYTLAISFCIVISGNAAKTDTVLVYSKVMDTALKAVVIVPDSYQASNKNYPVVYLLHGLGGNYANWIKRVPEIETYADLHEIIIVCTDGKNSWYFNNPTDSGSNFETYVAVEIPEFIDKNYRTIAHRKGRAITGLSMGGHGGLFLGMKHAKTFSACGSMSGAVDLKPFSERWGIGKFLGDTIPGFSWADYTVMYLIEKPLSDSLSIIIDCGTKDFFYETNKRLHEKLSALNIAHDFISRPGTHDWNYWKNAIQYQLLFFRNHFNSMKP